MQEQDEGGVIVNIASVSGTRGSPGSAAYGAAKAGLLNLTVSLAVDYAPKVRVNAVTAGMIETEQSHLFYGDEEGIAAVSATVPLGRLGTPADVADACVFLASPMAAYVSGANLLLHGGGETSRVLGRGEEHQRVAGDLPRVAPARVPAAGRRWPRPARRGRARWCCSRSTRATTRRRTRTRARTPTSRRPRRRCASPPHRAGSSSARPSRTSRCSDDARYGGLLGREYNAVTPENQMKWDTIHPAPDRYHFGPADEIVEFAARQRHGGARAHAGLVPPGARLGERPRVDAARSSNGCCATTSGGSSATTAAASRSGTSSTRRSTATESCGTASGPA